MCPQLIELSLSHKEHSNLAKFSRLCFIFALYMLSFDEYSSIFNFSVEDIKSYIRYSSSKSPKQDECDTRSQMFQGFQITTSYITSSQRVDYDHLCIHFSDVLATLKPETNYVRFNNILCIKHQFGVFLQYATRVYKNNE